MATYEEKWASITDLVLATLLSSRNTYLFRKILRERQFKRLKKESVKMAFTRLHQKDLIKRVEKGWVITPEGKKYLEESRLMGYIPSPFTSESEKHITIISFDIPEKNRKVRNWLRNQLKIFGYKMLQQSLWIGPGPLPQKFFQRLEKLNIRKNIKTFRIKRVT